MLTSVGGAPPQDCVGAWPFSASLLDLVHSAATLASAGLQHISCFLVSLQVHFLCWNGFSTAFLSWSGDSQEFLPELPTAEACCYMGSRCVTTHSPGPACCTPMFLLYPRPALCHACLPPWIDCRVGTYSAWHTAPGNICLLNDFGMSQRLSLI